MSSYPDWRLAFVLPNLCLGQHHRSPSELTLGLEGIAIVPASDPRVGKITKWSEAAKRFLGSFHDGNGNAITPAVLIAREDWHSGIIGSPEAVIAFRNAVAVASILPFRAVLQNGGWLGVSWSEAFDYHPARLRLDGSKFDSWTPALNSIGFRLKGLSLTPDLRVPRTHLCHTDTLLAERLGQVWYRRYRRRIDRHRSARVFRSLEMAYEGLGMRFRSYSSLSEVGLNAVPWVTSMEVLASPEQRLVTKWDCARLIGQHEFSDPRLRSRKHWVKDKKGRRHMNLAQRMFVRLYEARNKFVHGDRVSAKLLLTPGK
ncbi:MAG: hypothetical protein OXI83_13220, partial [Gemmatimonadota bacterium]|nr:hypothetical protein [Gemmatimonadota bacterium]